MTKAGRPQFRWTAEALDELADMAGRIPAARIADALGCSYWAVVKAADRLGLSLRCPVSRLVWCDGCANWRSGVSKRAGLCRVCRMREQLAGREAACVEEYTAMTPEQRAVYDAQEAKRGTRPSSLGPRPKLGESSPMSMRERRKAKADHLLALEDWEYRRLLLPYNAAKTRLKRMREIRGTNPRKGPKQL